MKILIVRFSSIGDIVLTSPVMRCIKTQLPDAKIHFLTKAQFLPVIEANPYIDRIITIRHSVKEVIGELKAAQYDHIVDLHKNLRTKQLMLLMGRKAHTFNKLNKKKLLMVWFKINLLPPVNIVERYLETVKYLGVANDKQGLDHFIPKKDEVDLNTLPDFLRKGYIVIVAGAKQFTKRIPAEKIISICRQIGIPVILIGGPEDREKGDIIVEQAATGSIFNACGLFSLNGSASLIRQSQLVVTADTGMMHIAAALKKRVISIWGNTIPEFGMFPYFPEGMEQQSHIIEVKNLKCRPCTKLGYNQCPRGHFKCMTEIDEEQVVRIISGHCQAPLG